MGVANPSRAVSFAPRALLLAGALVLLAVVLSTPVAASDDACPNRRYEVDDSYVASAPLTCQFKTIQEVLLLPGLTPGDLIYIYNGSYAIASNITTNGLSFVGESRSNVILDGSTLLGPSLRIRAQLTNLTNLTLKGYDWPLEVGYLSYANWTNITEVNLASGSSWGCVCYGPNTRLRDVAIYGVPNGFLSNSSVDIDGLRVNTTGNASSYKLYFFGNDVRVDNVLAWGSTTTYGLYLSGGSNMTFRNIGIENTSFGVGIFSGTPSFRNLVVNSSTYSVYIATTGSFNFDGFTARSGTYALYVRAPAWVNLTNADFRKFDTAVYWSGGAGLNATNILIRDTTAQGMQLSTDYTYNLTNASFDVTSFAAIYVVASYASLNWNLGSANNSSFGVYFNWQALALNLTNVTFTNLSSYAVYDGYNTGALRIENNTVRNSYAGFYTYYAGGAAGGRIASNLLENLIGEGLYFYDIRYSTVADNILNNVSIPISFSLSPYDDPRHYISMPTSNLIDGQPVYYLLNTSGVSVAGNASQVFIINSTNITFTGLNQSHAYIGVQITLSSGVRVSDSRLRGSQWWTTIQAYSSTGLGLKNITGAGVFSYLGYFYNVSNASAIGFSEESPASFGYVWYLDTVTNMTIADGVAVNFSSLVYAWNTRAVTVTNLTGAIFSWTGLYFGLSTQTNITDVRIFNAGYAFQLWSSNDMSFTDVLSINATNYGMYSSSSTFVNLTRFASLSSSAYGAYLSSSNNWTVRNSSFYTENSYGIYLISSPDFRTYNSTYVSVNSTSFFVGSGSFALIAIHNNFYGGAISNANGYGSWDGGYPIAGNYYGYAAASFADQFSGAAQTGPGKDGVKDTPYGVGGGRNDNYPLVDPWPPDVALTSPRNGSLLRAGTALNFSVSNFFDSAVYVDSFDGATGPLTYPHDMNTTGWADGWHNITITATDPAITSPLYAAPIVVKTFSFEFDSTPPVLDATPALGSIAVGKGTIIQLRITDPHLNTSRYTVDGSSTTTGVPPFLVDTSAWTAGNHTILIYANDSLNNSVSYTWTFYLDDQFPTLSLLGPLGVEFIRPGVRLTFAAADNFLLDRVVYSAVETNLSWSYSDFLAVNGSNYSLDTATWADGCYVVNVYATDAAGHTTPFARQYCVDSQVPDLSAYLDPYSDYTDEDVLHSFDGSLVVDLDWAPNYTWQFDDELLLAPVTLYGLSPGWTFATPGGYLVTLTVVDRAGNANSTPFVIYVGDMTPPVADFTLPAEWDEDVPLQLDATGSLDNDGYWDGGANGTFSWNVTGPGGTFLLSGIDETITIGVPGLYTVTLIVEDAALNSDTLERQVRIRDTHAPVVSLTGVRVYNEGETVTLNASASTDNDPASALHFSWSFTYDGAPVGFASSAMTYSFAKPGTYVITLTVRDDSNNPATQTINLRINDVPAVKNFPPPTVLEGDSWEWTVEVEDSDNDPITLTKVSGPTTMTITGLSLDYIPGRGTYGVYTIVLGVSDGITTVNHSFVLTVLRPASAANRPPYFTSFPPQSGTPGQSWNYQPTGADPDSDRVTFALVSGPAGMTIDGTGTLRWTVPANATDDSTYSIVLVLSDGLETVYQNFTIRVRASNQAPRIDTTKLQTAFEVEAGQTVEIVIPPNAVNDEDDLFDRLTFWVLPASPADATVVSVRVGVNAQGQPTIFVTGLREGTATIRLRVADPSGASEEATLSSTVRPAPTGGIPLLYLLLGVAVAGGAVGGYLILARRKKGEEGKEIVQVEVPPQPELEEVKAELVQVAPPAPAAAPPPAAVPRAPPVAPAAAAAAFGAAAGAAAAARKLEAEAPPEPAAPSKAATYVIEGLFVIYQDGRLLYQKTDIGQGQLGDPQLVSSMFTAVQQFIKDSFSAEGELNKMGYGENQILIERGNHLFMAVIVFGEPDKELQEKMQTAIEKIEYAYAGVVENWDGLTSRFANIEQFVVPVLALTTETTRGDVLQATTTKEVKVLSQLEFFQGFVRLKVGVKNDTEAVITKVTLDIDYNEDVLRLQRIEPSSYKTSGARVMLGVLNTGEKSSVAFYFDPQICTETNIDGIVRYRDYKGVLKSVTMKTRKAEVVCPLFFTKEHANTAMLKRLIESELNEKDSKIYNITKLPPYVKHKDLFEVCKSVVLSHDVQMVREFVTYNPFGGEAWFYGETKVKGYKIVIRTAVREDGNAIEFFAASSVIKAVTGLLAEFNHTLVSMINERYSDVKVEQVFDEAAKHEIQAKALVDKLGEAEAATGETEQK